MPIETFDKWLRATKTVGFPIVTAMALGYVGWTFGNRLLDSHEKFLDRTTNTQDKLAETVEKVAETQQEMAEGQQEMHELTLESTLILRGLKKDE